MDWCEPRDLNDWGKRSFSLQSGIFLLAILLLVLLEFRFDWMEKALGSYLSTTNRKRPETGLIWETAHNTQKARDSLDRITVDRQTVQRNTRGAEDLSDIVSSLADGQSVMISADHFRSLYMKLAHGIASQILSPAELLQLLGENRWDRTYFRKSGTLLTIYLIDGDNRVLREIALSENALVQIERRRAVFEGSLEGWGAKPEEIYPADRFFSALNSLPKDVQTEILAQPERLIEESGRPIRVGFLSPSQTTWMDVGYELSDGSQCRVFILPAHEWAWRQLRTLLEQAPAESTPEPADTEATIPQ